MKWYFMSVANITYKIYGEDDQCSIILVSSYTFRNKKYTFTKDPKYLKLEFKDDMRPSIKELGGSSYYIEFTGDEIITDEYDGVKFVKSNRTTQNAHKEICKKKNTNYHHHKLIFEH